MGENLRLGQCEAFKKGIDKAMFQMSSPPLIQRPDIEWSRYDADLLSGRSVGVGEALLAQQSGEHPIVFLCKGSETLATIEGEGATKLIENMEQTDCPGFAEVIVTDICEVSDSITVQTKVTEGDDG